MSTRPLLHPESVDDMLLYVLWRFQSTASALVIRMCESEFGITRREWRLLSHLASRAGMLSSELAERMELDRARTSRALTSLAHKGLVRRTPRPGDRRLVLIDLTDEGRALHEAVLPRVAAINHALMEVLSEEEARALDGVFARLQAQAERLAQGERRP